MSVALQQRLAQAVLKALHVGQFAYNESPTIAVAKDCWFRARHHQTRPFFLFRILDPQTIADRP